MSVEESNSSLNSEVSEFHWLLEMVQSIDAGLVVLDGEYRVKLWNGFMENHSAMMPSQVRGQVLFDLFEEIPVDWFKRKVETVRKLRSQAFTTWEQRPYIFRFPNFRPLTGLSPYMYQNMTIIPLTAVHGATDDICLIVYDVTAVATNKIRLGEVNDELAKLSRTDALTGLFNRGYWEEQLKCEFNRYNRTDLTSTLVMFDIDHFKKVNDTFGHHAGDEVIRAVSECLQKTARTTDIVGRYGGEEFGAILINTDAAQARYFAERLRKRIEQLEVMQGGSSIRFTISLGIAESIQRFECHEHWIQAADKALYQSKSNGRNCTTVADSK
ncbi:MAG: GGDEF domain-containing protein [Motiliproteus sp.]|nr:GGDEF domain-containing protein [Motiliproteus sp.]MCW9053894.1 GGDEF domain-containing protein [Motiliproteus sp.]